MTYKQFQDSKAIETWLLKDITQRLYNIDRIDWTTNRVYASNKEVWAD